ncbi:MAG: hypothetical protein RBS68_14800 [Anaerolineales bacterium]|jgi:hypothetical protein|nr:hypothetical protein [Anaerolineales bacterium]
MKKRILSCLFVLVLAFSLASGVSAQNYSFTLEREEADVYVNPDGSLTVEYAFTFVNASGASPIDFVDVGLPNGNYESSSITADVDGKPVSISSDYQGNGSHGVAVELGSHAIPAGQRGTVHVRVGVIERMLFPDDKDKDYASMNFSPTWFGSEFVKGSSDLTVRFHLPPGIQPEEPRYHLAKGGWPCDKEPTAALDAGGQIVYTWQCADAKGYTQYTFGASFPAKYVPEGVIVRPSLWDKLNIDTDALFGFGFICCFGGFFFGAPILAAVNEHKRKKQYLPPKISIEGHGIKRGLTAVEAAILMGQPLEKAMTMVLFSIIKKQAAEVVTRDPLQLKVADPLPEGLREYEKDFLAAFNESKEAARRKSLQAMTVNLVKAVGEKMKGFSRKETLEYYKSINEKAWAQIAAAGTPEVQSQMFEEALEWTMLDKNYNERARRTFTGPIFIPTWWGRYDPTYRGASIPGGSGSAPVSMGGSGRTSLPGADFAASVVVGTQNFASKVLGGNFTEGVTKVTNPPPAPSRSSGSRSSGGGGGCACACACAGCACACAGGGR